MCLLHGSPINVAEAAFILSGAAWVALPRFGVRETEQQARERRLATTGSADETDPFARGERPERRLNVFLAAPS
jgi:hypothetical protein